MDIADPAREPAIARPDDPGLTHLAVVGDTYTVLLSGEQTAGRFAMLDMVIPPCGGPPPHRVLTDAEREARLRIAVAKAPEYGMEFVAPPEAEA